ncbi:uncharacterized protein LOC134762632 [Penaeus indicus]|uniref:uncharacterized protein LOC134762632 n=1 Tax=Penaeus indicus TaxID=29960 RepID=UPI00300C45C5
MRGSAVVVAALVTLQLASCAALYPDTFYRKLRLSNSHRNLVKNARTMTLDPPAALGTESGETEGRQLDGEPDASTDAPAEADTEAPEEATEAPVVCGGEVPTLLETGEVREDKLLINTTVETPGYGGEGYPADLECIWNVNVESGCALGFVIWNIDSGHIRPTRGCSDDFVEMGFDGAYTEKYCGTINGKSGVKLWSESVNGERSLNIRFLAGTRRGNAGGGKGIKIYITGFCSIYSDEYVAAAEATAETATEAVAEDATQRSDLDLDYNEDAVGEEVF